MAITDRTRKLLWGRSGSLCAYCKRELIEDATSTDRESIVGDEAHIIGDKTGSARCNFEPVIDDRDGYENLILLCKVHHKLVDDQPETFTVERLRKLKQNHETWVRDVLSPSSGKQRPHFVNLPRIVTGSQLTNVSSGSFAYLFNHDELRTNAEMELVSSFLQESQDWTDIWADLDAGDQVQARYSLSQQLKVLEGAGLAAFGLQQHRKVKIHGKVHDWPTAVISVVYLSNGAITELGDLASIILESSQIAAIG